MRTKEPLSISELLTGCLNNVLGVRVKTELKVAVVTGSTGGIGQEVCKNLASQGWDLVLINRNGEKAEAQLEQLHKASPERAFRSHIAFFNPDTVPKMKTKVLPHKDQD